MNYMYSYSFNLEYSSRQGEVSFRNIFHIYICKTILVMYMYVV